MNELILARAIFRGGAFLLAIVAVTLLGLELKWVVVQVFAASIVAAGMAPVVARVTDPARTRTWRWRPPPQPETRPGTSGIHHLAVLSWVSSRSGVGR